MALATNIPVWILLAVVLATVLASSDKKDDKISAESSSLAKFVLTLSKPGAFKKTHPVFGDDIMQNVTSCPPGEDGLECRRAEARRRADDCPAGEDCDMCRACDTHHSSRWPQCCQHNSMCCSQLAAACQHCDKHDLINFCNKHFKRCFHV